MKNPEIYQSRLKHCKSSPEERKTAFTRAIKVLSQSGQTLTLRSIAKRAALYLPETQSPLLIALRTYSEEQLKEIGLSADELEDMGLLV